MDNRTDRTTGRIARLAADPLRLRRWSLVALAGLIVLVVASRLLSGAGGGMLTALTWVCAPFVALGLGVGDASFVRHDRGMRRILATILVAMLVSLTTCVILASISGSSTVGTHGLLIASLYAVFYAGIVVGLAGLIALGIGRGEGYVSRRIDRMSGEDW